MATPKRRESWIPHFVLIMGVVVFAFPIYFALIGSTHDAATIATGRMPLLPGGHMLDNYWQALTSGSGERVSSTPVRALDDQQPDHGAGDRRRQDRHLHHLRLCRDVLQLSRCGCSSSG